MSCKMHYYFLGFLSIFVIVILFFLYSSNTNNYDKKINTYNETHIHADILVSIEGNQNILRQNIKEYQSNEHIARHEFLHLHDNNPSVIHIHSSQKTLSEFLGSLGLKLDSKCLSLNSEKNTCKGDGLKLFVNSEEYINEFDTYIPNDLDKILLTDVSGEKMDKLLREVTNEACIQSGKCEREEGQKINESCTTKGGCSLPAKIEPLELEIIECATGGCSGQLCLSIEKVNEIFTTCEYKEEYSCLHYTKCEKQNNGKCGWTKTTKHTECLQNT